MPALSAMLCGIELKNPTILASGVLGTTLSSLRRVAENGAGAVTLKSITLKPKHGHNNPILIEVEGGFLNAVGYSNPGVEAAKKEFKDLRTINVPVIGSIVAGDAKEFGILMEKISDINFAAIELALSCPHTPGFGVMAGHSTPKAAKEITKEVRKKTKLPLFVKLSPNTPELGKIAKAAEKGGADAITAVNTMGPGMVIDINTGHHVLDFRCGGMSGPALKPIAVRCVYDIYKSVKIPVIGVGGISTGNDAIEMMMAGATAVGVGTAVHYRGIDVFKKISLEIEDFMRELGYESLDEIIGLSHKKEEHAKLEERRRGRFKRLLKRRKRKTKKKK